MQKVIDVFFAFVIALVAILLLMTVGYILPSQAMVPKATEVLRLTAVRIEGVECSGSGSIVEAKSGHHYILTNSHVCMCAKYLGRLYATMEGGELIKGSITKENWEADLCAARVEDSRPALKLARVLLPLTEVNTRGYPSGRLVESHGHVKGAIAWDWMLGIGEVGMCPQGSEATYDFNGTLAGCRLHFVSILSSLYARPGSSGSAVVNDDGELVGVISSWHPGDDFDAGQVPLSAVRKFVGKL